MTSTAVYHSHQRQRPSPTGIRSSAQRVHLQLDGPRNIRRHLQRAVARFVVLLASDLASLFLLGMVVRAMQGVALPIVGSLPLAGLFAQAQFGAALAVGLILTGNYGQGDARRNPRALLLGSALASALPLWVGLWTVGPGTALPTFTVATLLVWAALLLERFTVDAVLARLPVTRPQASRTVFVGSEDECRGAANGAAFRDTTQYRVLGSVASNGGPAPSALGHVGELYTVLLEQRAEVVVICGGLDDQIFRLVVQAAHDAGCQLLAIPRRFEITGVEPQLVWQHGQPLIELTSPAFKGRDQVLKRLLDILLSAAGLVLLSPFVALIVIAIRLESRGPAFYQSARWGRFWSKMGIWKFRTMVDGADSLLQKDDKLREAYDQNIKIEDDPRITRVGRLLRRTSVDELPQLFNVLWGEMSLVGPRPKLIGEERRYGLAMDTVLSVRPGMTGLWQVSGRNSTTYEERVELDIKYASHPSLWDDFVILLRTMPVVLRGTGAH